MRLVNAEKRKNTCENEIGFDKEKQGEMGKDEEKSCPLYNTLTHPSCISYQASRVYIPTVCAIFPQWWIKHPRTRRQNITHIFYLQKYQIEAEASILVPLFNQLIKHWYRKKYWYLWREHCLLSSFHLSVADKKNLLKCFQIFYAFIESQEPRSIRCEKYCSFAGNTNVNGYSICNECIRNYVR